MRNEIRAPFGEWDPVTPAEAAGLFLSCGSPWWIAGGYALELFAGRTWRPHGDLDVLLLARDQLAAQSALAGWEWWAADPPGVLRPWARGEVLPEQVHDIWCRPSASSPWRIQVMLDSCSGDFWVSRRNPTLRIPVASLGIVVDGVPCLRPEVQLFSKAADPRPKDELDFQAVAGLLDADALTWFRTAVGSTYGTGHPWLVG